MRQGSGAAGDRRGEREHSDAGADLRCKGNGKRVGKSAYRWAALGIGSVDDPTLTRAEEHSRAALFAFNASPWPAPNLSVDVPR